MSSRQPVGERPRRRLLERPEEHDHEQEQRCPENGDETVGLGAEHACGQHVVGVGENPGRDGRSREEHRAVEAPRRPDGAFGRDGRIDRHLSHAEPPANTGRTGFEACPRHTPRIMRCRRPPG